MGVLGAFHLELETLSLGQVLAGTAITAVIQSSSVTTVLVVGFVSAGLMGLSQSIGVIIGANVGTTITASPAFPCLRGCWHAARKVASSA